MISDKFCLLRAPSRPRGARLVNACRNPKFYDTCCRDRDIPTLVGPDTHARTTHFPARLASRNLALTALKLGDTRCKLRGALPRRGSQLKSSNERARRNGVHSAPNRAARIMCHRGERIIIVIALLITLISFKPNRAQYQTARIVTALEINLI